MSAEQQLYQMFIIEMEKAKTAWLEYAAKLFENPSDADKKSLYKKIFLSAHNLKAAAQMCQVPDLGVFFHKLEDLISAYTKGRLQSDLGIPDLISLSQSMLEQWYLHVKIRTVAAPDCKILFKKIEDLLSANAVGGLTDDRAKSEAPSNSAPQPDSKARRKTEFASKKAAINDKILVGSAGLDEMMNLIGGMSVSFEILMHHLRESYDLQRREETYLHNIGQTILWLKETCLQIRMQPARMLLDNLENAIIDVSTKLKKPVLVHRLGDDILLDKSVLEGLFDILLHIVRNAIDHGIENFQTRQDAGKELIANLSLSVADVGGTAVIEISDDGRGIDPAVILRKAIERGLVKSDEALSYEQIIEFIFTPEFSTAQEVTAISGRGIGMDIVRSAIQAMGGSIHVQSVVGKGTTFKIVVPTQMSLIEAFVVTVNKERYAVPKQDLLEIIDLNDRQTEVGGFKPTEAVRVGAQMSPAISLRTWLGYAAPIVGETLAGGRPPESVALVLKKDDLPFAFLVDEIRGLQQVFVRPVPENMAGIPAVTGAAVFSDGEPGLILNLPTLLSSAQGAA